MAELLREVIRSTDGAFVEKGRLYIAFAGDVRGAAKATRRLMSLTKERGVVTRYRLVVEPFPEDLSNVAHKIIDGDVKVSERPPHVSEEAVEPVE